MKKYLKAIIYFTMVALGVFLIIGTIATYPITLKGYYNEYQQNPSTWLVWFPIVQFLSSLGFGGLLCISGKRGLGEILSNINQKVKSVIGHTLICLIITVYLGGGIYYLVNHFTLIIDFEELEFLNPFMNIGTITIFGFLLLIACSFVLCYLILKKRRVK